MKRETCSRRQLSRCDGSHLVNNGMVRNPSNNGYSFSANYIVYFFVKLYIGFMFYQRFCFIITNHCFCNVISIRCKDSTGLVCDKIWFIFILFWGIELHSAKKFLYTTWSSNNSINICYRTLKICVSKTECPLSSVHKINTETVMHGCTHSLNSSIAKSLYKNCKKRSLCPFKCWWPCLSGTPV